MLQDKLEELYEMHEELLEMYFKTWNTLFAIKHLLDKNDIMIKNIESDLLN